MLRAIASWERGGLRMTACGTVLPHRTDIADHEQRARAVARSYFMHVRRCDRCLLYLAEHHPEFIAPTIRRAAELEAA